jgi:hypothetical protein
MQRLFMDFSQLFQLLTMLLFAFHAKSCVRSNSCRSVPAARPRPRTNLRTALRTGSSGARGSSHKVLKLLVAGPRLELGTYGL